MLAGCSSSTLLSPRNRLIRTEKSSAIGFAMNTQRLDLPCSFSRKDAAGGRVPAPALNLRPLNPPLLKPTKSLKRLPELDHESSSITTAKRKRLSENNPGNFWVLPNEVISSQPPFRRHGRPLEASGSSSSSETERFHENIQEQEQEQQQPGNGSRNPYHHSPHAVDLEKQEQEQEEQGFELLTLLTSCVDAIGAKNIALITTLIQNLGSLAHPRSSSPMSRLISYYSEAMALRLAGVFPHVFHITPPRDLPEEHDNGGTALRILNDVTPLPKFIHFTANEIFLRAFEGKERVHIIDFDLKQGLQWPSLLQSLSSRSPPPSHVRITGVGESKQELMDSGDRLAGIAASFSLPFEFHPVVDRLEDVRLWMLHVKEKETVAVNCVLQLHKLLYNGGGGALRDFLGLIRSTHPAIVAVAEQEGDHNAAALESRVANSLPYYSAIFDSLDACLPLESSARSKIEEMYGGEIRNIIACEGRERFERHVSFQQWRKMMERERFRSLGIEEQEMNQSHLLLKMYGSDGYYNVRKEEDDGAAAITISWKEQPLYTVSAWKPVEEEDHHQS